MHFKDRQAQIQAKEIPRFPLLASIIVVSLLIFLLFIMIVQGQGIGKAGGLFWAAEHADQQNTLSVTEGGDQAAACLLGGAGLQSDG